MRRGLPAAVAAWLALHYPDIRDEIIRREPLMLITHGDPAGLSTEDKAAVLLNFARKHAAGEIADDSVDRRALGMFGSPDLADAVHQAWNINAREDFRADLMCRSHAPCERAFAPLGQRRHVVLMTNSNMIGCMTGRSAGFSPLRIRPT
jgi:hypothetical protein